MRIMTSTNSTQSAHPRLPALARWALFWTLFIGAGALLGVGMMWINPDAFGMAPLLWQMQDHLPLIGGWIASFALPGVFLLVVIGVPNFVGAVLIWRRHKIAPWWAMACGIILVCWILLQLLVVFGPNPTSVVYLVFGLAQLVMAAFWVRQGPRPI